MSSSSIFRSSGARRQLLAGLLGASAFGFVVDAKAFCRTTTCDPSEAHCTQDPSTGCITTGFGLFWAGKCISFEVDHAGSPKSKLTHDQARAAIEDAYRAWLDADCGGASPTLAMYRSPEPIACDHQEYNQCHGNANSWIFLDDNWPYPAGKGHQIALTTLTFNVENGEIFDVDVEINSAQFTITTNDTAVEADLQSIATHESGHFFGLSHSNVSGATMQPSYNSGDLSLRTLSDDDIKAICSVYPPDRKYEACDVSKVPRHGFSAECGHTGRDSNEASCPDSGCCTTAPQGASGSTGPALFATLAGLGLFAVRLGARRRRSPPEGRRPPTRRSA